MGIGDWLRKLRGREDAAAIARAEERDHETAEELRMSSGDIEGIGADNRAARMAGEASMNDVDRLGD